MATERAQRKLAAVLAADVVGYSRLMGADEGGTLRQLKAHRRALVDPNIAQHRGRIVKTTGDGMLVEFASAVDAVCCAIEVQRGMAERNTDVPHDKRIDFRIGINVGDIITEGGDIFGDGVNVAARLETLAEPGGLCVSARVQEDVIGRLPVSFEDRGDQHVKNIARPVRVYALDPKSIAELPSFPDGLLQEQDEYPEVSRFGFGLSDAQGIRIRWSLVALALIAITAVSAWKLTERYGKSTTEQSSHADAGNENPFGTARVDHRELNDRRYLLQQPQPVDPAPFVLALGPGKLHDPTELIAYPVGESLYPVGRRAGLDLKQFIEVEAIVAKREPGFGRGTKHQRRHHRDKQCDEVLDEQGASRTSQRKIRRKEF